MSYEYASGERGAVEPEKLLAETLGKVVRNQVRAAVAKLKGVLCGTVAECARDGVFYSVCFKYHTAAENAALPRREFPSLVFIVAALPVSVKTVEHSLYERCKGAFTPAVFPVKDVHTVRKRQIKLMQLSEVFYVT